MSKKIKIKILAPVAGAFGMSANVGDEIEIIESQADEMIDLGYAKKVEFKKAKK